MRILHILNELKLSGAETMLRTAASYWQARGIQGEILSTGDQLGDYAPALQQAGYQLHHIPFERSPKFLLNIYLFLRAQRFEAIHIHCERANFWYAALAFLAGTRRIARSVHSTFAFEGSLRVRRWLQRVFLRRCLGVRTVAVSPAVAKVEWQTYNNPCEAILDWFDDHRFQPPAPSERESARLRLGLPRDAFVLLTIGNCSPAKNHAALIRALPRITGSLDVLYLHAGGEDGMHSERSLAEELNVTSRIRFLGPVADITPLLHAADLFLMPSLKEGLGIAALEAMGAGLPTILADVDGLRDLREVAPSGCWVKPEPEAIAQAILHFAAMEANERQSVGRELSRSVRQHCSIEAGAGRYASLYAEMGRA